MMNVDRQRRGILCAGNWIVDQIKMIDHYPSQDQLALIDSQQPANGGAAFNVLMDLARMDVACPLQGMGLIGDDANGQWIRDRVREAGIDDRLLLSTAEAPTSFTDVMTVADSGRRTFFHALGSNAMLAPEHCRVEESRARIFHIGYLLLLPALDAAHPTHGTHFAVVMERARAQGMLTSVDAVTVPDPRYADVVRSVLPHTDLLLLNETEAGQATGRRTREGDVLRRGEVEAAGRELLAGGVNRWVIIHYPEGACGVAAGGEVVWQSSLQLPDGWIAGAVGAGDAFAAGVLWALHEERGLADALQLAVCAAAANLQDPSASGGLMPLDRIQALAAEFPARPPVP